MKGILKKTMSVVFLSSALALTALGVTGCTYDAEWDTKTTFEENAFIVYNKTLHKGDMYVKGLHPSGIQSLPTIETDCGMTRTTNDITLSPDRPQEDEYQYVCEECFNEL